jgi:hypothetical protein
VVTATRIDAINTATLDCGLENKKIESGNEEGEDGDFKSRRKRHELQVFLHKAAVKKPSQNEQGDRRSGSPDHRKSLPYSINEHVIYSDKAQSDTDDD